MRSFSKTFRLLAGAALLSVIPLAGAYASDLPAQPDEPAAPAAPAPEQVTWTGFYAGVYGSDNWEQSTSKSFSVPGTSTSPSGQFGYSDHGHGHAGGGVWAGYLADIPSANFAFGGEGTVGWSGAEGTINRGVITGSNLPGNIGASGTQQDGASAELRVRAGFYSFDGEVLFYGIAGGVISQFDTKANVFAGNAALFSADRKKWEAGITEGLGAEGKFYGPFSLRAEYVVQEFPEIKGMTQSARLGLAYHF